MALYLRYSLLRYYYSNLFLVSLGEKGSFFKPVFFNYYDDLNTYENIDTTIMIGDSLILFPVLKNETDDFNAYFPNDDWNYMNGTKFLSKNLSKNEGTNVSLSGAYDIIHLYIKGGSIIPFQDMNKKYAKNSYYLRKNPLEIIINPESKFHTANGTFIFDNDELYDLNVEDYNRFDLSFDKNILTVKHNKKMVSNYQYYDDIISFVKIYNIEYLLDEYYDILSVYSNQGNTYNLIIDYLDNNVIICDLRKIKLKLRDINNMKLEKNNFHKH
jgi:alpha-glucosidase (family GH31 glycosyl hydrolase)